jgi:hypothetical protein
MQTPDAESLFHRDADYESHSANSRDSPYPMDRVIQTTEGHCQPNLGEEAISSFSSEFNPGSCPNQPGDQTGIRESVEVADFCRSPDWESDEAAHQVVPPSSLPPITGDSKYVTPQKWESLSASERVAFLQRWMMYVEVKYQSPVADWPEKFAAEWMITKDSPSAAQCLVAAGQKVAAGKSVLNYVTRAMEGNLPEDVEQWHALYVQAYHITGTVNRTCARLQCMIDTALVESLP